jgi:hypothetical protein
MSTRSDSRNLFINTARTMAIIRHHQRSGPCHSGILVSLSPSQRVRDGLAAAADQFARNVEVADLDMSQANAFVTAALANAPVANWWKITPTASPPQHLGSDDVYIWPETVGLA